VAIQVPGLEATISSDGQRVHSLVANQLPSLGATISLDEPKDHTSSVTTQVPSLGATISPDGQHVHSLVTSKVPSLGVTISLDGQQDHNQVANQVPSPGATISPDDPQVHTQVASKNTNPNASATSPNCTNPFTRVDSSNKSPSKGNEIWPTNLLDTIQAITPPPPQQLTQPEFSFELTSEAAEKNYLMLMWTYMGSLANSLEVQHDSMVGYGSEFCNVKTLR
jgi:hypothetical protein